MPVVQTLFLIRALPGAGKTTLAMQLDLDIYEADQFFVDAIGAYIFDPSKLPQAHAECQGNTRACLEKGDSCVVSNTFTQRWELEPYLQMAKDNNVRVTVIDLYDSGCTDDELKDRNTHGVPLDSIKAMRDRWEHDWKNGNPVPPWER